MDSNNVPMMFRAQVQNRCQIHRVDKSKQRQDAEKWVDEWKQIFPKSSLPADVKPQPTQRIPPPVVRHNSVNRAINRPVQNTSAFARPSQQKLAASEEDITFKLPQFGSKIKTWEYTISWRLVSNSGQDEGVIRPIISAKGFPYYSGASMKGTFLRACRQICTKEETENYCGEKLADGSSKPGILRFHGAYPVNMDWTNRLVDIIHCQDEKQVIEDKTTNANAQISLYQAKLKFGISSIKELTELEWERIKHIWERALAGGIGSRVSAGYGHFQEVNHYHQLLQIKLKGQGPTSQLINGTKEFRPNMFKAVLRGHTLRLLGGMTDQNTAKNITKKLWGGFEDNKSVVGYLGINFNFDYGKIQFQKSEKFFKFPFGNLNIFCMHDEIDELKINQLIETVQALLKFSLLFGGFGKSWRRVCHKLFYHENYFNNPRKQVIGCHWEFFQESESLYYPINDLDDIAKSIDNIRNTISHWIPQDKLVKDGIQTWREAWYQPKVLVWGRLAEDGISQAINWFHDAYQDTDSIKNPHTLTGSIWQTGRIWHRMYPRFVLKESRILEREKGYVELLTIFPDESEKTQNFLTFLEKNSEFKNIW